MWNDFLVELMSILRSLAICLLALLAVNADAEGVPADCTQLILGIAPTWNSMRGELRLFEKDRGGEWVAVAGLVPVLFGKNGVACGLRPAVACGFGDLPGEAVPIGDLVAAGGGVPAGEGAPAPGLVVAPALAPAPVAAPVVVVAAPVVVVEVPPETPTPTAAPWLTP